MKLSELCGKIGATLKGEDVEVTDIASLDSAGESDITFVSNPKYAAKLKTTKAAAVIISEGVDTPMPALVSRNPYLSFAKALAVFREPPPRIAPGISPHAATDGAKVAESAAVGAFSYISPGASIGDDTVVMPNVFIGEDAVLGRGCFIYPGVTIREKVKIGDGVIIQPGAVIGSDGYGYVQDGGVHVKIPQTGSVTLGDNVEVGANTAIDRGAVEDTVIGAGTKIDNLVHIAHNVKIGQNCLILGQTGLAGSVVIGNNTTLASQSGVAGHLKIGNNVIVAARGGVIKDIPDGEVVSGFPARKHFEMMRVQAAMMHLPELVKKAGIGRRPKKYK